MHKISYPFVAVLIATLALSGCAKKPSQPEPQDASSITDAPDEEIKICERGTFCGWDVNSDSEADSSDDEDDEEERMNRLAIYNRKPPKELPPKDFSNRKPFRFTVSTDIPLTGNPRTDKMLDYDIPLNLKLDYGRYLTIVDEMKKKGTKFKDLDEYDQNLYRRFQEGAKANPNIGSETIRYQVAVHSEDDRYPVQYDLDCDGDGVYEHIGLTDMQTCEYKYNSGKYQINVRGDIPAIWLCASGYIQGKDGWLPEMYTNSDLEDICQQDEDEDGMPDQFRCLLPWRQQSFCPSPVWELPHDVAIATEQCKDYPKFEEDQFDRWHLVVSIDDWGDVEWKSMMGFAADCVRLNKLPKKGPDLSQVTDMSHAFENTFSFNQPLENWDVSHVENMEMMFSETWSFNKPLNKWNVSNVTNMNMMFSMASSFNQPLNRWNISKVKTMDSMFSDAPRFNQKLDVWDVSHVDSMNCLFSGAEAFSHYPAKWVVPAGNPGCMFSETKVEDLAEEKPLKERKVDNGDDE